MKSPGAKQIVLALLPPLAALGLQWLAWPDLKPFIWFLFYPAVFMSSWIGGRKGGILATILSILLVDYFFVKPVGSFAVGDPKYFLSIGLFLMMGVIFSEFHEHLRQANATAAAALAASRAELAHAQATEALLDQARELLEKRVVASTQELAAIVESSDDAIIGKSLGGIITSWNRGAERIFGYRAAEVLGQPMQMLFPPERRNEEPEILARIGRGESVEHFETERIRKDGRRINVSVTISPLRDGAGTIIGASKIARDITEQRQAQEALRLSEAQMKVVVESLQDGLVIADTESRLLHWNPAALRIHGFTSLAEGLRQLRELDPVFELSTEEGVVLPVSEWPMSRVLRGETLRDLEVRVRRPGTDWKRIFSYTGTLVEYVAGKSLALLTVSDITGRKEAEALRQAVTGAEVGTWHRDLKTGELKSSARCKQIFGFPPEAEPNRTDFLAAMVPADRELAERAAERALANHTDYEAEMQVRWPDGSRHWVVSKGRGYYAPDGKAVRMEGVALDITARKEAEAEIKSLYANLKDHAAKLDAANHELEAFSYSVSHDLRAPLRHITGFVHLLRKEMTPVLTPAGQKHLSTITKATQRMGVLIDDLLAFSRISRVEMQKTTVDLTALVREIVGDLAEDTKGRAVTMKIHNLPVVQADRALLRLVLVNLLSNAVKFTGTRPAAVIEVGPVPGAETVVFIRDNGVGFDPAYAHKLFGVFQRLHSTQEFEGTGIGLANVQRIVQRHGGRAWAEGTMDGGATFYFSLPHNPHSL